MGYNATELHNATTVEEIGDWLDACETASRLEDSGGTKYTPWSKKVLISLRAQYNARKGQAHPLSGKQLLVLRDMYDQS